MRRIEKKIRKTAVGCLKALIKMEANAKDLVANDEKLKMILRPVLLCLQQDFKIFSPPFLAILKQLLKLLFQCFNKALSDKLLEHLNIRKINHLNNDSKCISGILALFEHLTYTYHNSSLNACENLESIVKISLKIESLFKALCGKTQIYYITRIPLVHFINKMASVAYQYFLKSENLQDQETIKLFLDLLVKKIKIYQYLNKFLYFFINNLEYG